MRDRGVSVTLNYTLVLGITAILVVGLLTAGSGFVESQRNSVIDSELRVIGERLAADLATADRLAQLGESSTALNVTAQLPKTVAGTSYRIEVVTAGGNTSLELTTDSLDRVVTARVANTTAIEPTEFPGGPVEIVYTGGKLEVRDA